MRTPKCRWAHGQHMLRPSVTGRVLQALLHRRRKGTGDRHRQRLCHGLPFFLAAHVHTVELYPELAQSARANLASLGVRTAEVLEADALRMHGGPDYDVIAVTASLPIYDARFERMLAVGGRLFIVVGEAPAMDARLVTRTAADTWKMQSLFETVVDPLVNSVRPQEFTF